MTEHEQEHDKGQGLEPFTLKPSDVASFKVWVDGYLDGTYGTGKRNQSCEVNPQFLAGLLEYQSQEVERLRALLSELVEVGPPADDNHSRYACCGVHYTQEHPAWCPWLQAKQALQAPTAHHSHNRRRLRMDNARLDEIRERADRATAGPWSVVAGGNGFYLCSAYPDDPTSASNDMVLAEFEGYGNSSQQHADTLFCCYARQDIPDLLSHISAQDAELATLRQLVDSSYVLREKPWRGLDKEATQ